METDNVIDININRPLIFVHQCYHPVDKPHLWFDNNEHFTEYEDASIAADARIKELHRQYPDADDNDYCVVIFTEETRFILCKGTDPIYHLELLDLL